MALQYATPQDLIDRFGASELRQQTDREGTGEIDMAAVQRALNDATEAADAQLGRVYALPLTGCTKPLQGGGSELVAPPVLTRIVCDLARYYLFTDVPENHDAVRRYRAAQMDLATIGDGKLLLSCPWGGSPGTPLRADPMDSGEVLYSFAPRRVTDDSTRGYL